ncbi:MAG: LysR family transcriptional regulator [Myxococcales bacterium]|nr:LysR family transcriptional regulator [Myxococcales bacterium]
MAVPAIMHGVHLPGVDLNLLVAFEALLAERSVTRAAARLGLTQPATSHALARLRALLDDPVLVRTARGMVPTERALALEPVVRRALGDLSEALAPTSFSPATAERMFTLGTGDYAEMVVLPGLAAEVARSAPQVSLLVRPVPEPFVQELEDRRLDVVLSPSVPEVAGIHTRRLFDERFVCVVREGHPGVGGRLTLDRYCSLSHLLIAPRGRPGSFVDTALAEMGRKRRVALTVPHFLVAPMVVAESDLVLTLAERVARRFAKTFGLRVLPPPFEIGGFSIHLFWHARVNDDPGHVWLRQQILAASGPARPKR